MIWALGENGGEQLGRVEVGADQRKTSDFRAEWRLCRKIIWLGKLQLGNPALPTLVWTKTVNHSQSICGYVILYLWYMQYFTVIWLSLHYVFSFSLLSFSLIYFFHLILFLAKLIGIFSPQFSQSVLFRFKDGCSTSSAVKNIMPD